MSFKRQIKLIDLTKYFKGSALMLVGYMFCANCLGATFGTQFLSYMFLSWFLLSTLITYAVWYVANK